MLLAVCSMQFCNDFETLTKITPLKKVSQAIDALTKMAAMKKLSCDEHAMQMLQRAREMDPTRLRARREYLRMLVQLNSSLSVLGYYIHALGMKHFHLPMYYLFLIIYLS